MKKLFVILVIIPFAVAVLALPKAVLAQSAGITIDYRYNALLENFLQLISNNQPVDTAEENTRSAYEKITGIFLKQHSFEDFTRIMQETGLSSFTEKKWTSFDDQMASIGVTTVKGDFITPDGVTHTITFYVIIAGDTEIKIGKIVEEVALADLAKRAPSAEILGKTAKDDLKNIATFIKRNKIKATLRYLSNAAAARIKLKDISKAFSQLRKQKIDVTLPRKSVMTLTPPLALNEQGQLLVQGSYKNRKSTINFLLTYDYEDWKWRLGGFSFWAGQK